MPHGREGVTQSEPISRMIDDLRAGEATSRWKAAKALGQLGAQAIPATSALVEALADRSILLRVAAAEALGALGPAARDAIPALITALHDRYASVREVAAEALGNFGSDAREAARPLVELLNDENTYVRAQAEGALVRMGSGAVPALIEALSHADPPRRAAATSILGKMGTPALAALPAIRRLAEDADDSVRAAAEGATRCLYDRLPGLADAHTCEPVEEDAPDPLRGDEIDDRSSTSAGRPPIGAGDTPESYIWRLPKVLQLGRLRPGVAQHRVVRIYVPIATRLSADVPGLSVEPEALPPGANEVTLRIVPAEDEGPLKGRLWLISSSSKRWITLRGQVSSTAAAPAPGRSVIWEPLDWEELRTPRHGSSPSGGTDEFATRPFEETTRHSPAHDRFDDSDVHPADVDGSFGRGDDPFDDEFQETVSPDRRNQHPTPLVSGPPKLVIRPRPAPPASSPGISAASPAVKSAVAIALLSVPIACVVWTWQQSNNPASTSHRAATNPVVRNVAPAPVPHTAERERETQAAEREHGTQAAERERETQATEGPPAPSSGPLTIAKNATPKPSVPVTPPPVKADRVNSIGMKLVRIPAGTFSMGAVQSDDPSERPRHPVRITRPFYLGVFEVTQSEWKSVMTDRPNPSWFSPEAKGSGREKVSGHDTSSHPVEIVSWFDAIQFCNRLSEKEGLAPYYKIDGEEVAVVEPWAQGYRLPTEAEWEYACRSGAETHWFFGDSIGELPNFAWFSQNSGEQTHPVGQKRPNPFGLFDVYGNVSEWCWDWDGPYGPKPLIDPLGPPSGRFRLMRGGAWTSYKADITSARRFALPPTERHKDTGFRVARTASEPGS